MFRISARTVLELGSELISSDVIAFYELIKNGFDARTKSGVDIRFDIVLRKNDYLTLRARVVARASDIETAKSQIFERTNANATTGALAVFTGLIESATDHDELVNALDQVQASCNTIVVSDTGSGMSLADLEKNFLVIGTASRKYEVEQALAAGKTESPYLGEKGIGRLSAMRLG